MYVGIKYFIWLWYTRRNEKQSYEFQDSSTSNAFPDMCNEMCTCAANDS